MVSVEEIVEILSNILVDQVGNEGNVTKAELSDIGLEFNKQLNELKEKAEVQESPEEVDEEDDEFEDADPDAEDEGTEDSPEDKPKE